MKILLTGADGFIGKPLSYMLLKHGYDLQCVRRNPASKNDLVLPEITPSTHWGDALLGVDVVIHLAGRAHVLEGGNRAIAIHRIQNVDCTINLASQAAAAKVKRFIYLSSIKAVGEETPHGIPFNDQTECVPKDPYGISKFEAEQGIKKVASLSNLEFVIIRPPLVYGPNPRGNIASAVNLIKNHVPLPFGNIPNLRSFVSIDNLIDLIILCVINPLAANKTFLVSDNFDLSTSDFLDKIRTTLNIKVPMFPFPSFLLKIALSLIGKKNLYRRIFGSLQIDISKTMSTLGWSPPLTVEEGLKKMLIKNE